MITLENGKKQVLMLALSLTVSILLGFIPSWTGINFTLADQIQFTLGLFITFLLIDIVWIISKMASRGVKEHDLWKIREDCDAELINIRYSYFQLIQGAYSKKDLFLAYFMNEFQDLARKIKDATDKHELRISANHLLNVDYVLDAFIGQQDRILRYTWPISDKEKLFDEYGWRRYFELTTEMALQGELNKIQGMFILDDLTLIANTRIKKLLDFFHTHKGLECRIVIKSDFEAICTSNSIPLNYIDFGIYGNRLLFRSEQYKPEIIGTFTKDALLIRNYTDLFDTIWNMPGIGRNNPSSETTLVTIEELMDIDTNSPV